MDQEVGHFRKNSGERVYGSLTEFNGHQLVDLRVRFHDKKAAKDGTFLPTKKGLTISVHHLPELQALLRDVEVAARKSGFIK